MDGLSSQELDKICDKQLFNLPYFRGMLRAVEQSFYQKQILPEPILDIGAGDGHFAWALLQSKQVVGIDPWLEPLTEAHERNVYTFLIQSQGSTLPFENKSFSCVMSNSVLEHIPDIQPVLNEIGRVITPGGFFLFAVPNQKFKHELWGITLLKKIGLKDLSDKYSRLFNKIARHHHLDEPSIWINRLEVAGFKKVEYWNYFPVEAMRMLERGHVAGLPNLLWKLLFGHWVLWKSRKNPFIRYQKIRKLIENSVTDDGACTFFVARRDQ